MVIDLQDTLWNSPLYRETVALVLGSLFVLGALIFFTRKTTNAMLAAWLSVQSWLFAAPVFLVLLGLPGPWVLGVLTIISILGAKTFFQITGMYHRSLFVWVCYLGLIASAYLIHERRLDLYNLMPMIVLGCICVIPILQDSAKQMLQYISLCLICFIFLGWAFMHIGLLLHKNQGPYLVIYIVLLTEVCDNIYLAGSRLGRLRLFSNIHTKRTFEGFIIAFACTMTLAWGLRHMLPNQAQEYWIASGLVASLAGSMGDLVLSVIRRDLGIKDVGAFIIGRGDLLTRMDRLIFVAPIFYYTLEILETYPL